MFIGCQIYQLWHKYLELCKASPKFITAWLQYKYDGRIRDKWDEYIIRSNTQVRSGSTHINDTIIYFDSKLGELNEAKANQLRARTATLQSLPGHQRKLSIVNLAMFPPIDVHPVLFEHKILAAGAEGEHPARPQQHAEYRGLHLIVLAHGFQGNSCDMRLFKDTIVQLHPDALVLCSQANETSSDGDILAMGENLASEVSNYIKDNCPGPALGRLSFAGHSLGGMIIRAALPRLDEFSDKMYTYITFSTPHLGFLYNSSTIVDAGLWLLKRWKGSTALSQLTMSDHQDMRETFCFKLSQFKVA